ncbi:hypothetical protein AB9F45_25960 [Rhizobium leguminosarum]|uniref:hypothetical protein n=1 Tax=Rhizobium leguminosarum TaxID=384 RepID=UPI003F996935
MATARLQLPQKFDLATIFDFAQELDYYVYHDALKLIFPSTAFFAPFSMLFLASKFKSMRERNPDLQLDCNGHKEHSYAAHMGFFQHLGFDHGREVGEAWGGENYLPITELRRDSLYETPSDENFELADLIQRHADKLAIMIARDREKNRDMYDVLSYSIREVMRNVFEHSQSNRLYYCAQYWPKSHKVEFAVADFGVGIRRGLGENPNFRFATDKEAIEYSLLPSVSGKTHLPRRSEVWFNSGYGLYMTSRLARNGGNFVLASGSTGIHLSRRTKNNYKTSFPGTVLRFNMDIDEIGSVSTRLTQFRKEGTQIAKTIAGSGNRPPSAMSLLLRRDYADGKL